MARGSPQEVKKDEEEEVEKWLWEDTIPPSEKVMKDMMAMALATAVKKVFSSHVYRVGDNYYLQGDRGPIGHILTCTVARLIMTYFDMIYLEMLTKLGIAMIMYRRYVDDIDCVAKRLKRSVVFDREQCRLVDTNPGVEMEMMTDNEMMTLLRDIANGVVNMIDWEFDVVDNHEDLQLPVLDLKIHVDKDDRANLIKHRFYQKKVANKGLVDARSCMPASMTFSTLVEEGCRRVRNTSPALLELEKAELIREFNSRLMKAGHRQDFRIRVTQRVLDKVKKMENDEKQGIRKRYRSREEVIKFRKENKRKLSKTGWFQARGYQGVFKCENTPRGILAKRIRERLDSDPDLRALRIMVQEKNGIPLSHLTNHADPEPKNVCERMDCFVCETSRDPVKGRCWQEGIVYKITCLVCKNLGFEAQYHGESGFSSYVRGRQHLEGMRNKTQGNVL